MFYNDDVMLSFVVYFCNVVLFCFVLFVFFFVVVVASFIYINMSSLFLFYCLVYKSFRRDVCV